MSEKINYGKEDVVERLAVANGTTKKEAAAALKGVTSVINEMLKEGSEDKTVKVSLRGFGKWTSKWVKERTMKPNEILKTEKVIPAHLAVSAKSTMEI